MGETATQLRETRCWTAARASPAFSQILQEIYRDASADYREWLTEYMSPVACAACSGKRLRPASLAVRVKNISIAEFTAMPISRALLTVRPGSSRPREADRRPRGGRDSAPAGISDAVGLHYLSLDRSAATLSGGEAQRIRLATQIGSKLRGVLYVSMSLRSDCIRATTSVCWKR